MIKGETTKQRILETGLELARGGLHLVTSRNVGGRLDISHSNVLYHFGSAEKLRNEVAEFAVRRQDRKAVIRLLMDDHPACRGFTDAQRAAYRT